MTLPSLPTGYDYSKRVAAGRSDCQITVGFDRRRNHIPRFLVQLHYLPPSTDDDWRVIARMDHNELSSLGHNVYHEGLHVDVHRRTSSTVHLGLSHSSLPSNRGTVIRACAGYLRDEADYFIDVYEERHSPGRPPGWPDGGKPTRTLISPNLLSEAMSQESSGERTFSLEELGEELAEATGTSPEEIEQGAADIEIRPPEDATVVDE